MAPKGCAIQHDLPYDPVRPLEHHRGIVNPSIAANHQVERRRLRDWEVGGLRALQDSVHVGGRASIPVGATWTICQDCRRRQTRSLRTPPAGGAEPLGRLPLHVAKLPLALLEDLGNTCGSRVSTRGRGENADSGETPRLRRLAGDRPKEDREKCEASNRDHPYRHGGRR